ncbi:MAG: hypothetical protein II872_07230, partial [Clostridia bacterium]|nr:hypothetical protein [Clostridia bacterium]
VDAGTIVNTVKANAKAVRGDDPAEVTASATVTTVDASAKLSITKTANPTSGVKVGDEITYTVVVTNTGNVTVKNGTLSDDHADLSGETFELAPGKSKTFTYTYTVTQTDVDAGTIVNTVKANAKAVRGDDPAEVTASATVTTVDASAKLGITKTANPTADAPVGSDITYTIVVKNEGNVTLKNVKVADDLTGDAWEIATLAPGASETYTATYTVTQADVDAGELNNTATATAKAVRGEDPAKVSASAKVTFTQTPALTVEKVVTSNPSDPYDQYVLDDEVKYEITVTNSGNVTLKNVKITDELTGDEWTIVSLAPGKSQTFTTAAYKVTSDDVVAGSVKNVAVGTATSPKGEEVKGEAEVEVQTMKRNDNDIDVDSGNIEVVYDGKAHTSTATATVAGSTVWYSTDGGTTWTKTAPSRTAVGTTTFSIKATHPAYEDVVKDGYTITVTPKGLTVTIEDKDKIYGDADPKLTFKVEGLVDGETIPADFFTIYRDAGEDVGTYAIHADMPGTTAFVRLRAKFIATADGFDASNYDIKINEGTFTINPRTVTVTADDKTKLKGKEDPELTATVEGLVNGDTISYTLSREPGEAVGKYTITPEGEETQGNYVVTYKTGTLTIIKPTQKMGTFSLIWFSDAMLKGEGAYDDAFAAIVEKANHISALATLGTGNMVEAFDKDAAWTNAKQTIGSLKTGFYGVAGAKDVNGDEANYDAYLAAKLNDKTHESEDGSVWYKAFKQQPVLVVGIGYNKIAETDEEKELEEQRFAFVNKAIAQNPDKYVIILVNDYINANGELTEFGKLVEEKIVANNENVRLVLCGGADGAAQLEKTYGERKVNAILFNYTADAENGLGFLRVLSFDGKAKTLTITTVNALNDKTAYDEAKPEVDNFTIDEAF